MIKKKIFLILICAVFFLLAPRYSISKSEQDYAGGYKQLIRVFEEWLYWENKIVKQLTFKLSPVQAIKSGSCLKFMLVDNLGREWIFKSSFHRKSNSSIVVSRFFQLLGLECPVVHPISLNINGKNVYGGIQRFIPNKGTLSNFSPGQLSSNSLDYLMKTHVLYWLLDNYDANPSNFIVLSVNDSGEAEDIVRVDNEIAFIFLDRSKLGNVHKKMSGSYYHFFWEAYALNKIDLNLEANYAFVKFVESFPDWLIAKLIQPLITQDAEELANPDFTDLSIKEDYLLETIILRKNNLSKDFAEFYQDLAAKRGSTLILPKEPPYEKFIAQIRERLLNRIKELKKEISSIKKKNTPAYTSEIKAVFSFEGFKLLDNIYMIYWGKNGKDLAAKCNYALKRFSQLELAAVNKYEKRALELYRQEVEKISQGLKPSFAYSNINKLVDLVPYEELE